MNIVLLKSFNINHKLEFCTPHCPDTLRMSFDSCTSPPQPPGMGENFRCFSNPSVELGGWRVYVVLCTELPIPEPMPVSTLRCSPCRVFSPENDRFSSHITYIRWNVLQDVIEPLVHPCLLQHSL
jgi:hypothetical protein